MQDSKHTVRKARRLRNEKKIVIMAHFREQPPPQIVRKLLPVDWILRVKSCGVLLYLITSFHVYLLMVILNRMSIKLHSSERKKPKNWYRGYISGFQVSNKSGGPYSTLTLLKNK